MKKLKLTKADRQKLVAEFEQKLNEYEDDPALDKFSFEKSFNEKPESKLKIFFTPQAFLRSKALVETFKGEVGWNGLMKKLDEGQYLVYDIMVYPQTVNGVRTLDPTQTNEWFEKYIDVIEDMRFQAHSHVDMSTHPSGTDMTNQKETVRNLMGGGVQLFQIWNKKGDINSFFYDVDQNIMYDRNDIEVGILDEDYGALSAFVDDAKTLVEDMKPVVVNLPKVEKKAEPLNVGYKWNPPVYYENGEKIKDPFYWNDGVREGTW